jgi:predicted AlkP superfamily phosphohydrolase/phosphomutase
MGTLVFKPQDVYKVAKNVVPDLIVHFGALYWRSIGMLGTDSLYLQENDTGPDDCNHAQFGVFILASPDVPLRGEIEGMRLLDVIPTALELMGQKKPASMQGTSLLQKVAQQV